MIVADGGMGALITSAVPRLRCPEEANLRAPEAVVTLHVGYIKAGAELIETNTFGANRRKLASQYLEDEFEAINSTAVRLAREAREISGKEVFIAGSIGPLGELGDRPSEDRGGLFAEQATVLEGRGADVFTIETFFDLVELEAAIEAVRAVSSLPIVALLTFDEEAETLAGVSARDAAARLAELDVAAIGANHGAGPQAALAALEQMGANGLPLAAMPNIGLASLAGRRVIYPHATPEYFAEFAAQAQALGARIIGGCCGTTPVEITAISDAVKEGRQPSAPFEFAERELAVAVRTEAEETELARKLRAGEWVVSAQLDPPLGGDVTGLLDVARALKESGLVELVDINENSGARPAMAASVVAASIERVVGLETIPHVTSRDSTIMGLESMLLGAHAEGIRNILAVTGDPPEVGDYPGSRGVYEVDAIGLVELIAKLNAGENYNGRSIDAPTSFFIGCAVNPTADDLDLELERFARKIDCGAQYAMTQLVFDIEHLDRLLERLGGEPPIPLLVGIFPISSYRLALRFHNELPGIIVPEELQAALREAGPDAAKIGMEHARELLAECVAGPRASISARRSDARWQCSSCSKVRAVVPYARNPSDGVAVYFEADGGDGAPVVLYGGILDWVETVRDSQIAQFLPDDEFRLVYVDHRGVGRSDKPHDGESYAMPLRVQDAVAVLDQLGIERAHFIGNSWGARLGFGIGDHAPERVLSLVLGGQQPYAIDPDGPLARVVTDSLAVARTSGIEGFVEALEAFSGGRFPDAVRSVWLDNDPVAIEAAWSQALTEGAVSRDLRAWKVRCLIYASVEDVDFHDQARHAASEIPNAEFISISALDHVSAHLRPGSVLPAVLRGLRG